jgi:low affinity Fe/Cu permease
MKKYGPQILIAVLLITNLWQCNNNRSTSKAIQRIDEKIAKSEVREELFLIKLDELKEEHNTIALDSNKINEKHEKIRSMPIPDDVNDSLVRSIIARGKKRFN